MDTNKKYNEILVKEIRLKRIQLGLTQAELAKKVDISPIIYGHIETYRRELKILELFNLCNFLDLPINETLLKCKNKQNKIILGDDSKASYKNKVVGFTSFKGGAGVSTLTTLFCNKISSQYNILMIDAHYQLSCFNHRKNDLEIFPETKPQYEIKAIEIDKLSNYIDSVRSEYDYVVIDLPRFFYYENNLENIFTRCDFVFAPFYLSNYHRKKGESEYLRQVDGRLDLFIELSKKIKESNEDISFTLISFENDMSAEFKEWIENYDINLLPQTFKKHYELQSNLDTLTDLSKIKDIAYAPYIKDTLKLIYYLERETGANLYIEEQNNVRKQEWDNLLTKKNLSII